MGQLRPSEFLFKATTTITAITTTTTTNNNTATNTFSITGTNLEVVVVVGDLTNITDITTRRIMTEWAYTCRCRSSSHPHRPFPHPLQLRRWPRVKKKSTSNS
jgi:hypothetical protein